MKRRSYSTKERERIWDQSRGHAQYPCCNIPGCGALVTPGQRWVVSHFPVPHAHDGTEVGVAHERCNKLYWDNVEAPRVAKGKRQRRKHIGAFRSRQPLPGGREDYLNRKRTVDGRVVFRETLRQKLIAMGIIR